MTRDELTTFYAEQASSLTAEQQQEVGRIVAEELEKRSSESVSVEQVPENIEARARAIVETLAAHAPTWRPGVYDHPLGTLPLLEVNALATPRSKSALREHGTASSVEMIPTLRLGLWLGMAHSHPADFALNLALEDQLKQEFTKLDAGTPSLFDWVRDADASYRRIQFVVKETPRGYIFSTILGEFPPANDITEA